MKLQFPRITKFEINIQPDRTDENDFYTEKVFIPPQTFEELAPEIKQELSRIIISALKEFIPNSEPQATLIVGFWMNETTYTENIVLQVYLDKEGSMFFNSI